MTKLEYLQIAVDQRLHYRKAWLVSAFAMTRESPDILTTDSYLGRIVRETWGYAYVNEEQVLIPISDAPVDKPLFRFLDPITVTPRLAINVTTDIETTIGNLLFNLIAIIPAFHDRYPFVTGRVSIGSIEDRIALRLTDTPLLSDGTVDTTAVRSDEAIYVDEYMRFTDSLQFISSLSQLTAWSATPKSITAPPGIREFKQQLLTKYQGRLNNPVELAKFETELLAYDQAYLKGDPADGKFISGKIKNVARKKMFLAVGSEADFTDHVAVTPISNSLEEGWSRDPEQFTSMMNGLRVASYSRGHETIKGGVSAKTLLRSGNNFSIESIDCGSTLGIKRSYTTATIQQLIGRNIITSKGIVAVENINAASNYLNQTLVVRSPMYCKLSGDRLCRVCAGEKLAKFPNGLTIPLTEISSIILATSLKKMHGETLSVVKLDITKTLS